MRLLNLKHLAYQKRGFKTRFFAQFWLSQIVSLRRVKLRSRRSEPRSFSSAKMTRGRVGVRVRLGFWFLKNNFTIFRKQNWKKFKKKNKFLATTILFGSTLNNWRDIRLWENKTGLSIHLSSDTHDLSHFFLRI